MKKLGGILVILGVLVGSAGCSARLEILKYKEYDYVLYRTDSKGGTEGVGRDLYDASGKLVDSKFGSGQTLAGTVLQGAAGDALIAGGMVGAAAVLRPARTNVSNSQGQDQGQYQGQNQEAYSYSSAVAENYSILKNYNSNSNYSVNQNANNNSLKTTVKTKDHGNSK